MLSATVPRRSFVARLAAASTAVAAALGGTALTPRDAFAALAPDEMDRWFGSMKAPNKNIFDCTSPKGASDGVLFAHNLIRFSGEKLGTKPSEINAVICFRHFSTPFGYNDAMWAKYPMMAEALQVDDPTTKQRATRNWMLHELVMGEEKNNLPGLVERGAAFAVCGAATAFIAKLLAGDKGDAKAIEADLSANLIPGGKMAPAGVVALQRAQKAGFAYTSAG
jgi:intracellular sulfur oxidation DsrE/DsrF family protein